MYKISEAELEIMKLLWAAGEAIPFSRLQDEAEAATEWKKSTIKTLLERLVRKGFVEQQSRDVYYYRPLVTQEEYSDSAARSMLEQLYRGNAFQLLAGLLHSADLSDEEAEELSRMLREKRKEIEND